ncbi:MAG: glycosyltransferase [Methylocystis sp.]
MLSSPLAVQGGNRERPQNQLRRERAAFAPAQAGYFSLSPAPLVSIIIANLNGAAHLKYLFDSLKAQTYENFEIIFIDNSSKDDSVEIARSYNVERIVALQKNVGFAEANNLALQHCSGELVALLNNDMRVDANWLESMVSAIRQNPLIAAVAPKIRFWTKFQRLRMEGAEEFELDECALLDSLEYKKFFMPQGFRRVDRLCAAPEQKGSAIVLHAPIQSRPIKLQVHSEKVQEIRIGAVGANASSIRVAEGTNAYSFMQSEVDRREAYFVINNAGSALNANMEPYDRGFGHVDSGEFDRPEELDLLCGGSALIRRDALHRRKLFISELFAYYEDSELSVWMRDNGYKIVYCPNAIVYHKHSAATVERSAFWLRQTFRNKIIFDYVVAEPEAKPSVIERGRLHLNHMEQWYKSQPNVTASELEFSREIPELYGEIDKIVALIDSGEAIKNRALRIGVFNPYWATLGGGEAHALEVAAALTRFGQVELISTSNFDVKSLMGYFGYEELNVRKRIILDFVPEVTKDYDIFVNSCFLNETPSLAKKSYFIVSFPSRRPSEAFLRSYRFLSNSSYTLECMRKFWGDDAFFGEVLYPSVPSAFYVAPQDKQRLRKKVILSVGRFVSTGHIKNQHEIAEAFREFVARAPEVAKGWRLVLVGSVNDTDYLSKVREASAGLDVVIATQASFEDLCKFYREASIYVHASGYGRDQETEPELLEHFGIVVAQALASGCFPLVFGAGGPREIVETAGVGRTWRSLDELVDALQEAVVLFSTPQGEDMTRKAIAAAEAYSTGRLASQMNKLILYGR